MLSERTIERLIKLLAPDGFQTREDSEKAYPTRELPENAEVMRVPPSPTGFVHIGTVYAGLINERIAHQTGGVFILRIEDTDKKREVEGSLQGIVEAFKAFELNYDEGPEKDGAYGPYLQSQRGKIYLGYAVELLKNGWAYPCFSTSEELKANIEAQQTAKLRPGYYGKWALWRDKSDQEVSAALDSEKPFVLRFRSKGSHDKRIRYQDIFKGQMEVPENDLDVPLIKSDEYRLPTYHLAHVVDDHSMRITKVFRSDEWLPSTALHIELAQALNVEPFTYGHFAPISIIDKKGGGKRKLSKRKDIEADVQFWLKTGYPIEGIKAYLLGLANSNFEDWYRTNPDKPLHEFKISLEKLAASRAPLLDMGKLEDYCKDYISRLDNQEFNNAILAHEPKLQMQAEKDKDYVETVFAIERDGDKPRKDLAKWSDAYEHYGYFFDELFEQDFENRIDDLLKDFEPETVKNALNGYLEIYAHSDSKDDWLAKTRAYGDKLGMSLRDLTQILRIKLSGKTRTPDLWEILQILGEKRVHSRLTT